MNDWIVSVELHTLPGEPAECPTAGERVIAPSEGLLSAAKQRGLRIAVAATDRTFYGERYDSLVDAWLTADTSDPASVLAAVHGIDGTVVAVTSSVDNFVRVAAVVADKLGLSGPDPHGEGIQRDKARVRRAVEVAGIPDARWGAADAADPGLRSPIGYPAVAKPVDGAASWDVAVVNDDEEARALASRHMDRSYGRGVRPRRRLLFEEVLSGPVFSAEGLVTDDATCILGYSSRVMAPPPHFVELALTFSGDAPSPEVPDFVQRILGAIGHSWGPFHLEFVLTEGGPRLIENNARFVGAGLQHAIHRLTGVAPGELLLAALLGERQPWPTFSGAVSEARLVAPRSGTLAGADGLTASLDVDGVYSSGLYVCPGDAVSAELDSNSARIGFVQALGNDRDSAFGSAAAGLSRIRLDIR